MGRKGGREREGARGREGHNSRGFFSFGCDVMENFSRD